MRESSIRYLAAAITVLTALCIPALAAQKTSAEFDWKAWQHLPVQAAGRYKPLDTVAREALRTYCDRSSFTDPRSDRKIGPVAMYLMMLFDWQGWDWPSEPPPPDEWDRTG